MNARQLRALRGTAAASVATIVSAAAHTLAGGGAPSPLLIGAVLVLAAPAAMLLVGPRVSLARTAAAVVLSQIVFHVAFVIAGSLGPLTVQTGHHVHATAAMPAGMSHVALLPDGPMLVAHALAAALTVLAVSRGERMLSAVARGIVRLLPRLIVPVARPVEAAPRVAASARSLVVVELHLRTPPPRRGPPLLVS